MIKSDEFVTEVKPYGHIRQVIEYKDGRQEVKEFPNALLRKGREALASCLANEIGDGFEFYINRMLFGDGGTSGGSVRYVNTERNGLFGITRASKPVIASIDPDTPSQAIFSSVITFAEANGTVLNEMALQMANGDLYSMITFPDLNKTDQLQIHWSWRLSFV